MFDKYLLSVYYVICIVLGVEFRVINRIYKNFMLWSLYWGVVYKLEEGGYEK